MLKIDKLCVSVEGKDVLQDMNMSLESGEIHAIMGPNGSGKSTLAFTVSGHPNYEVTSGSIMFNGENLLDLNPEDRAAKGIFVLFQNPIEIPGVKNISFMRSMVNNIRQKQNLDQFDALDFLDYVKPVAEKLDVTDEMLDRSLHVGFSGGERKRMEVLQVCLLKPTLVVLDELDSGLDVDALKMLSNAVGDLGKESKCSIIIITHYPRLLNYLKPHKISVLKGGKIVKQGKMDLALEIEKSGYAFLDKET